MRLWCLVAGAGVVAGSLESLGCVWVGKSGPNRDTPKVSPLATRGEQTNYTEGASADDVDHFLDTLAARAGASDSLHFWPASPLRLGLVARTPSGHAVPYVVAARPMAMTPADARNLDRPIVFVHATGGIEGTEAMLATLRDLVLAPSPNVLDSVLIVAVPMEYPDAAPVAAALGASGTSGSTAGFPRDVVPADRPETRGALGLMADWDPDVLLEFRGTATPHPDTTTAQSAMSPGRGQLAVLLGPYARDTLVPALETQLGELAAADPLEVDDYVTLRGRVGVVSTADPGASLRTKVESARGVIRALLSLVVAQGDGMRARSAAADSAVRAWGAGEVADSVPALPIGEEPLRLPYAYALAESDTAAVQLLRVHGVEVERLRSPATASVEQFILDSVVAAPRPASDGHRTVRVVGTWQRTIDAVTLPANSYVVPGGQRLGLLALALLEPTSDRGFVAWNIFDRELSPGAAYPVARVVY